MQVFCQSTYIQDRSILIFFSGWFSYHTFLNKGVTIFDPLLLKGCKTINVWFDQNGFILIFGINIFIFTPLVDIE